jgi:probable F420-dependent oxidoreductase
MKWGAVLPTNEIGHDSGALRDWAQGVEAMGFDRIIAYDHVLGATHADREPPLTGPYTEMDPFHEPFVTFGYMAAVTQRIELMTGVLILPQRQAALVAKQAVQLDIVSNGRFVLGVGTGWNHVEYESLGMSFAERGKVLDEQVEVIRRLFNDPLVDMTGDHHRIDRAGLLPMPTSPIPIWFGGWSPPALRRGARLGDGFLFGGVGRATRDLVPRLRDLLVAEGRDPATFPIDTIIQPGPSMEKIVEGANAWHDLGATHLSISTMVPAGETRRPNVDAHLQVLAEMRAAVAG